MAGAMFAKIQTPISKAIFNNDIAELKAVLKNGEKPFETDRKGNTYLHYVCTMYRPFIFHIIVGTGINLNAQNRHGNTALHVTALQHECCHVGDLLAAGIDPTIRNKDGKMAAEIPTRNMYWKSIYNKYQPGIFEAVANHDAEKVLYLLHCWSRVDTKRDGQTLRQFSASRKFHDLVFLFDVHRHILGAIHSILEADPEKAWGFLSHSKCDINFLNYASETCHILQHALKLKDIRLVRMICKSKVNVNIRVTVQGYLKAPLFFAAIHSKLPEDITWTVLKAGADFSLKDERGRNAAVFALDKTNRKIPCEIIAYMMKNGLDVSQRDITGVTLRDVARFARRRDILEIIDKEYVKIIRSSNMTELERFAKMGYDSMLIDFNYRDTFIYASGNETEEVLKLTRWLPKFYVRQFHDGVQQWSLDKVKDFLATAERPDLLINARDKGGRAVLHLCIMHWRFDILKMLLADPNVDVNATDNVGRTAYHYACAIEEEDEMKEFCILLENDRVDKELVDYRNHKAAFNVNNMKAHEWINKERKTQYGMEIKLACIDKYEELCRIIKCKRKSLKHFEQSVCRFKHPIFQFSKILSPLMPEYRDLLFVALDAGKEDIAVRLIHLGTNWRRKELCQEVIDSDGTPKSRSVLMSALEKSKKLGMQKVVSAIQKSEDFLKKQEKEEKEKSNILRIKRQEIEVIRKTRWSDGHKETASDVGNGVEKYNDGDEEEEVYFEEEVVESDSDEDANNNDSSLYTSFDEAEESCHYDLLPDLL